jgi:hypothetical protein
METFTMSGKELPRAGLVAAALAGRISNGEGAVALRMTARQFQRLKARFREGGAPALRHQGRGRLSHRRLPASATVQVQALLSGVYKGFKDTHATEKLLYNGELIARQPSADPAFALRPRPGGPERIRQASPHPDGTRKRSMKTALAELATVTPKHRRRHPWCDSFSRRAPFPGSITSRRA